MAKKFSISEGMLSGISKNTEKVSTLEAKENFKFEYIDIEKIRKNKNNFYEITDIDELVEDISINGLNHNLVVRPIENELYELISGERRYTALNKLVERGEDKFKKVPCKISDLNDLDSEIVLIQANAQSRELSDADKLKQIERLTELYNIKKSKGEKVGKIRDKIAKDTGLSPAQVGRYSAISKGLIKELKDVLEKGNLSISNASEFAVLSEENQRLILSVIKNEISISKNEANELKNKFKKIEKDKEDLLNKEEKYISEIKNLKDKNENTRKNINKEINSSIEEIASRRAKEVIDDFKNNKLNETNKDEECIAINHELKIRLKSVRKDMLKVAKLMENNTIIDETTIKEVENFKSELEFLNEKIDLYTKQNKS
ncbi:ParB/RepB/Spo0J family partition protein [Paraclostridium bifermentans]|uniref:ParB/RepB/Spo0J family partition protein n=1 Tax=Paraclostridium bifermentans TaxID=1490 RepID=UPI001F3DE638|nr:ParB/RepB/Spo0J family partition protein [Paraclostridium bifermentans]MCE9677453.1 ParB/RepB/Spo0J family partition protein [Paraclostridium bifermentans]